MPIWYWAISDQYGLTNLGLFTVDTRGEVLAATAIGLARPARWCSRALAFLDGRAAGVVPLRRRGPRRGRRVAAQVDLPTAADMRRP